MNKVINNTKSDIDKFNELYPEVFNEDGSVKSCGRAVTSKLISFANNIQPTMDFGDSNTGFMNIDSIQSLHKALNK